jgi:hypothetical protein
MDRVAAWFHLLLAPSVGTIVYVTAFGASRRVRRAHCIKFSAWIDQRSADFLLRILAARQVRCIGTAYLPCSSPETSCATSPANKLLHQVLPRACVRQRLKAPSVSRPVSVLHSTPYSTPLRAAETLGAYHRQKGHALGRRL